MNTDNSVYGLEIFSGNKYADGDKVSVIYDTSTGVFQYRLNVTSDRETVLLDVGFKHLNIRYHSEDERYMTIDDSGQYWNKPTTVASLKLAIAELVKYHDTGDIHNLEMAESYFWQSFNDTNDGIIKDIAEMVRKFFYVRVMG